MSRKKLPVARPVAEELENLFIRHLLMKELHLSPGEIDVMPHSEVMLHCDIISGEPDPLPT